ncbi:MAG: hypothetical protein KTR16_10460 [Acidiferrobacterales bacterium]|nr:hypothetical protein [Acidiferrobacterales bacterium]
MKLHQITIFGLLWIISACNNKVVVTSDDSADYQSAVELPPLKKNVVSDQQSVAIEIQSQAQNQNDPPQVSISGITSSIIDASGFRKRARIDAQIDQAWPYLLEQLKLSAVTIHTRNQTAARVEVGCGNINDGAVDAEEGGWSIFNRATIIYEYCVMQLSEAGGATTVYVLNRRGEEVSGEEAMTLLSKIVK